MPPIRLLALSCAALAALCGVAFAQDYPSRPVKIVVPFASGGSGDIFARVVGQHLSDALKQPFVVENCPGAGLDHRQRRGREVAGRRLHAAAGLSRRQRHAAASHQRTCVVPNKPFVPMRPPDDGRADQYFDGAGQPPSLPATSLQELIALAKASPGTLNFASPGSARRITSPASCSKRSPTSTSCTCPITACPRRAATSSAGRCR